jgi:hypothetical protein
MHFKISIILNPYYDKTSFSLPINAPTPNSPQQKAIVETNILFLSSNTADRWDALPNSASGSSQCHDRKY